MAFRIHGEVSLDGAMFKRGLSEVGGQTTEFLKRFALGAVGIASVEQAFEKTIDSAKELVDTSKKLDVTVEQLQVLRQAAEENGQEFDAMSKALERFNAIRENVLEGGKGSAAQSAALQRLGVSPTQLRDQTAAQTLMNQISATANKSNAADIANDLKTIFGRNGEELFGTLKTNFVDLEGEMKKYGELMDGMTAVQLKNFGESMEIAGHIIIAQLAPGLSQFARALLFAVGSLNSFTKGLAAAYYASPASKVPLRLPNESWWHSLWRKPIYSDFDNGKTWSGAVTAFGQNMGDPTELLDNFDAQNKKMLEALNNPKAQATTLPQDDPTTKRKAAHGRDDSLIEAGNFLGSASDSIGRIAQQHLDIAKRQLDKLGDIDLKLGKNMDAGDELGGVDFGG
jgi:hypothetical protein